MALAKTIKTFNNNFVIISSDSSGWYRSCFTHVMCLHVELKDTWLATADAKGDKTWMGTNTLSWHGMMLWNIYIYTYRYVSKYTSVDLCFLYIIHLREKNPFYLLCLYIYILLILPFYVSQTWLSPQAQKAMTKVIRHLTTCVVATLQDRYQTSTTSVRWKKQNLQAADDLAVHQLHWGFKQQRLAMAISCCVAQM